MTYTNVFLKELLPLLAEIKLEDNSSLKQLLLTSGGDFKIKMTNGLELKIPEMKEYLNENILYSAVTVAKNLKNRGIFESVTTFFHLLVLVLVIIGIAAIALVINAFTAKKYTCVCN